MERIASSAKIPSQFYVERAADIQLRNIINDMARPGYVLVARQMGKTNLLLHTKEKFQSDQEIYVYIDFSTMAEYTEEECLNSFIDTAIEVNWEKFEKAETQIHELREKSNYKASKMFSRELRILLKYVDKIVFILDEIDALTRREYSDHIFSLIRGHYFASSNFPELRKATFILSGVIEPKDIIKDHNISPFNIGEKIYLLDFSYPEFKRLTQNFDCLQTLSDALVQRLFYWTKGQPRISWDLCDAANKKTINSIEDIDDLVNELYLKFFDKAPIDSIRDMATNDTALRDAIIQLAINKGDTLSPQVKSRLYLAGIINWEEGANSFKNPIMAKSLSYDWLMQLQKKEMNFLAEAEKSIELEGDFNKSISMLKRFIDSSPAQSEDRNKAFYLLSLANYRLSNSQDSIEWLERIDEDSSFYIRALLLKSYNLADQGNLQESNEILEKIIINDKNVDKESYFRSAIARVANDLKKYEDDTLKEYIPLNELQLLDYDERMLSGILIDNKVDIARYQMISLFQYYRAVIFSLKGDLKSCLDALDLALLTAKDNEKPWLLYKKLILSSASNKKEIADELYKRLLELSDNFKRKDFDNTIDLNIWYVSEILAFLMLDFPELDVTPLLRAYLVESKENAVILVLSVLIDENFNRKDDFLKLILQLDDDEKWHFDLNGKIYLALRAIVCLNDLSYAYKIIDNHKEWPSPMPDTVIQLMAVITSFLRKKNSEISVLELVKLYNSKDKPVNCNLINYIMIKYHECWALQSVGRLIDFIEKAENLLKLIKENMQSDETIRSAGLSMDELEEVRNNLIRELDVANNDIMSLSEVNKYYIQTLNRNQKIKVFSLISGQEEIGKYKNFKNDLFHGNCKYLGTI